MFLRRQRIAGVVLALALAGALCAGMASGVERIRGRARKRPEPPPPFSQRDTPRSQGGAEGTFIPHVPHPVAPDPLTPGETVAPEVQGSSFAPRERDARPTQARGKRPPMWRGGAGVEAVGPAEATAPEESAETPARDGSRSGLTARIPAPMRVGWTVVEVSSGHVRLQAEVERRRGFGAPVEVRISLPRGAALVEGPPDFTVSEGTGGDIRTVAYVVTFAAGARPTEDLVLVAHAEGASFGAHAEQRYAFGRMPTAAPRPVPDGPVLSPSLMMGDAAPAPASETDEPLP